MEMLHPEWSYQAVLYEMNVRQLTAEGTLRAAAAKLGFLRDMGIDAVWLMPVYPIGVEGRKGSLGSYYSVRDYCAVDPCLGTMEDFDAFVAEAHRLGMKVLLDWIANHTARDARWVTEKPASWYERDASGAPAVPWDWTDTAKLNYAEREVWRAQGDAMEFWVREHGVDGFRCDVASFVPLEFWQQARRAVAKVNQDCIWLAETVHQSYGCMARRMGIYSALDFDEFSAFDLEYEYDVREAFDKSKEQQNEALTRLDATIKVNMEKSAALGETADRLTRALTGEVKVQGNFGELKLKQLLEDLELKEGEQFDTQETLRDKAGKQAKGDDGRGLIPDFILHFPNNRHVVVDSKMSLTDYERYMNAEDGTPEKSEYLKAHVASVRAQVKRLARKEYTKYLPEGYNRLNFAIMYVPIEGALNLALLNATTLWREAYDEGVMILGPQTMYMNLRVLEMMWTQVRQLKNQQAMIDAANIVVERVQDFGMRFMDVETSMNSTVEKMAKLKVSTAESGRSIITAAKSLLKAGAKENKKKKSLDEMDSTVFIESNE